MVNSYVRTVGIVLIFWNVLHLYDQPACHGSDLNIPEGRVLVIGIDGVRPDALRIADTPAIDELILEGAFTNNTKILGDRYRENETISGPGWSSFLTGVWADKHGVNDNTFRGQNYDEYPHFFVHLKRTFPEAITGSFVDWEPIDTFILRDVDVREVCPASSEDSLLQKDEKLANKAAKFLTQQNPHAVFVYFGQVDEIGHQDGFHPSVPSYLQALRTVDAHVATLMRAIQSRPEYLEENWLVVISTDHGGRGRKHRGGHDVPEIVTTFLVVSGVQSKKGMIEEPSYIVDVPIIALTHLGVPIDSAWQLDGKAVGIR
ncbi:MAG: alkaline phosphatase family protein [Pirellulales bacterium]|jgi:hypothetical protein